METGIDALFAAADVSGLTTNIQAILITFVGIGLLFLGSRYLKKAFGRG